MHQEDDQLSGDDRVSEEVPYVRPRGSKRDDKPSMKMHEVKMSATMRGNGDIRIGEKKRKTKFKRGNPAGNRRN